MLPSAGTLQDGAEGRHQGHCGGARWTRASGGGIEGDVGGSPPGCSAGCVWTVTADGLRPGCPRAETRHRARMLDPGRVLRARLPRSVHVRQLSGPAGDRRARSPERGMDARHCLRARRMQQEADLVRRFAARALDADNEQVRRGSADRDCVCARAEMTGSWPLVSGRSGGREVDPGTAWRLKR